MTVDSCLIIEKDSSNLWDQLRSLLYEQHYTTQDHASLALLQEFPNVFPFFLVRASDNLLMGATVLIELKEFIYGNIYIVREGHRAAGMGKQLMFRMLERLGDSLQRKPIVGRAVEKMFRIYEGPPYYASRLYEMYVSEFADLNELREFFPKYDNHLLLTVPLKKMNSIQKEALFEYDRYVTGADRSRFVQEYFFSVDFVDAVALFEPLGRVIGLIAVVPTSNEDGLLKIGPIYASSPKDAGVLANAICDRILHPKAHFVFHCRTGSAGEWMMDRMRQKGKIPRLASITFETTLHEHRYIERSRPELIFSPTNSPVHFDA